MLRSSFLIAALLSTACTQDIVLSELPDGAGPPFTEDPVDPIADNVPVDPQDDPAPEEDCVDTEDLIYVIDRAEEAIYTFDPTSAQFSLVGDLNCGAFEGSPGSMAVGRDGMAYVRYSSNNLFAVNLETMACEATPWGGTFGSFGMGYATQNDETWRDDLYVANANMLAHVDQNTFGIRNVGALPSQSELTGNAEGELWAFLPLESPARLVRLDKTNAEVLESHSLPAFTIDGLDTFAFATWGGDFYLFMRFYGMGSSTDVYKVDASGQFSALALDTGMDVVGAGVSTCAPTE